MTTKKSETKMTELEKLEIELKSLQSKKDEIKRLKQEIKESKQKEVELKKKQKLEQKKIQQEERSKRLQELMKEGKIEPKINKSEMIRKMILEGKSKEQIVEETGFTNKFVLDNMWRIEKQLGLR